MLARDPMRPHAPATRTPAAPAVADGPSPARPPRWRGALGAIGLAVLAVWAGWWAASLREGRLLGGERTWVPALPFLAGDFAVHFDHIGRVVAAGGDPYRLGDPVCCQDLYPPLATRLFAWTAMLSPAAAQGAWLVALAVLAAGGAWAAWRVRAECGLGDVPLPLALAAVLGSTPAVMALERGQFDLLVLPGLLGAAWLLRRESRAAEGLAGVLLAAAAWLKYYPGLLALGLLALRRWRALAGFVAAAAAIGLADLHGVRRSLENCRQAAATLDALRTGVFAWEHSLTATWRTLWPGTRWAWLARMPGPVAAVALLAPPLLWVSLRVARSPRPGRLIAPYFLWLVAAATFFPAISNDYNLVFLPLGALAVWDRRDPVLVHALLLPLLPWWQPWRLPIPATVLLAAKLSGLLGVGLSLAIRATEPAPPVAPRPHVAPAAHPA